MGHTGHGAQNMSDSVTRTILHTAQAHRREPDPHLTFEPGVAILGRLLRAPQ